MEDFLSFRKMITPIIIQVVFWIGVVVSVVSGLSIMFQGRAFLIGLIYVVLGPLMVRIYCELIILLFRIYDVLNDIKNNTNRG
ncbi:MAG: DUF4282 domain-containing protein [Thermoguttaceae bacterium]|jgi:hypothetical protein